MISISAQITIRKYFNKRRINKTTQQDLYHGKALMTIDKNLFVSKLSPSSSPNRTTTNFLEGITHTYCPPNPSQEKQSAGTSGSLRWLGPVAGPAFSHHMAP